MNSNSVEIIGITGGIGSGKSTISNHLIALGYEIIDADKISKDILSYNKDCIDEIRNTFGESLVNNRGMIRRKELSVIAFSDKTQLEKLNKITHKHIIKSIKNRVDELKSQKNKKVFIDAPLLIETGLNEMCNEVWLVVANESARIKRASLNYGISEDDVRKRADTQLNDAEKMKYADIIIWNNKSIEEMYKQVDNLLK